MFPDVVSEALQVMAAPGGVTVTSRSHRQADEL